MAAACDLGHNAGHRLGAFGFNVPVCAEGLMREAASETGGALHVS